MNKFLLLASTLMMLVLPIWAARTPDARRGLKRAVLWTAVFNTVWAVVVLVVFEVLKRRGVLFPAAVTP